MNPQQPGYGPPPYAQPSPAPAYQAAPAYYGGAPAGQPAPANAWAGSCPRCGSPNVTQPTFTAWGGILGGKLLNHRVCGQCRYGFNGRTGHGNGPGIAIYIVTTLIIACWVLGLVVDAPRSVAALFVGAPLYFMSAIALLGASIVVKSKRPDAFAPLIAAGLLEFVAAAVHWGISAAFTFADSRDLVGIADGVHHATSFIAIVSTALLAVALVRLARTPIFVRGAGPA